MSILLWRELNSGLVCGAVNYSGVLIGLGLGILTVTCADSKDFCHSGALQSGFGGGEKREQAVIGMACISMILPKVTACLTFNSTSSSSSLRPLIVHALPRRHSIAAQ
jgi:hypothetical protein